MAELAERLGQLLGCGITSLTPLTGGASRTTMAVEAAGRPPMILRLEPPGAARHQMELEARLLRAAAAAGVPVPGVVDASDDEAALGAAYMVLERIEGETIARRILRDDAYAAGRPLVVRQAATALARIHAIDPASVSGLEGGDQLASWAGVLHGLGEPHPAFEIALRFLEANRPAPGPDRLVHGDFRLGNLIIGPDGLRSVLDWELAHLGDPMEDLGWMCVRAWRFGSSRPALGLGDYDELLEAYRAESGQQVAAGDLAWWETFGTLRWGVMCGMMAVGALQSGRLSVELAAIGRRACENEWDVLSCLERAGLSFPEASLPEEQTSPPPGGGGLHDRPTAVELTAAVRRWLSETVSTSEAGRISFDARVASNVLGMVERELESQAVQTRVHEHLLGGLGIASEVELAAGIRSGELDWRDPALLGAVRWSVAAKLAVAHPGYEVDRA